MKKKLCLLFMILFISGCAVVKTPTISGVDQDNGKIKMSYNYGLFEKPDVKWNETLDSASAQCKNWGYIDAQQSTGPQTNCIKEDQKGNCISWQVDSLYKCNLSAEQQTALNEKREKEYIKQQEESKKIQAEREKQHIKQQEDNKRIEAVKKERLNKIKNLKLIFSCDSGEYWRPTKSAAQGILTNFKTASKTGQEYLYRNAMENNRCKPRNDFLQKQRSVLDRLELFDYDENTAYYTLDLTIMNDGIDSTWGIIGY
jgi:hypothetical protein